MEFHVMTLFPEMIVQGLSTSVLGRAIARGIISLNAVNIRDYTLDKHKRVDDYPYGGGAGMVMSADPVVRCCRSVFEKIEEKKRGEGKEAGRRRVIYLTPQGRTFSQEMAREFAKEEELVFLCGHYEGIDERAVEMVVTDQVSIGDYVLTGGELAVMVVIDAVARLVPGVLNNGDSAEFETFHDHLLEYPQYTRPEVYEGRAVPEVLLSGHHAKIEQWRRQQSIERTRALRPELLERAVKEGLV
ncbi:MAG: tRNA (guanosine(37)-N1)-methyltransferase TrmD [Lachnospiraceae bacterium]|nr:tRNA (guanosine(37)-N1)-methyltransferase TrmD [Lachnospiraceae bacterium]